MVPQERNYDCFIMLQVLYHKLLKLFMLVFLKRKGKENKLDFLKLKILGYGMCQSVVSDYTLWSGIDQLRSRFPTSQFC